MKDYDNKPHSSSSLDTADQCPYRYEQVRLLKNFKEESGAAAEFGTEQHDIAEHALKQDLPLGGEMGRAMEFVRGFTGLKTAERYLGIDIDLKPCDPYDEDVCWFRGKIDVTILNGNKAIIIDYKTGKRKLPYGVPGARKPDERQLLRYALLTCLHERHIEDIEAYFYWTHNGSRPDRYRFNKSLDADRMLANVRDRAKAIEKQKRTGKWEKTPGGLCEKWCCVSEGCEYHGQPYWKIKKMLEKRNA